MRLHLRQVITETPVADDFRRMSPRLRPRCPRCGRFARYDAYLDRWWCDLDERAVKA